MHKVIELKIAPEYFNAVITQEKKPSYDLMTAIIKLATSWF